MEAYADRIPLPDRIEALIFVFKDLFQKGILTPKEIRGFVLDLGCGNGAVGIILKKINPEVKITGVDTDKTVEEIVKANGYEDFSGKDALEFLNSAILKGQKFDLIIACGMPPEKIEEITQNIEPDAVLNPGGKIVLIVDSDVSLPEGSKFKKEAGSYPVGHNIIYYSQAAPNQINQAG